MKTELEVFKESIYQSWENLISHLPAFLLAIFIFLIGIIFIKIINKYSTNIIISKANDPLIADFILSVISLCLTVILFVICLGILGFDDVTNKILAGAGLTTFIIGFALKDIGENFLAGILMAFQKPFRIGDLIKIGNIKGRVIEMSLRSTTIKTLDGIDAYVPNASILKNNLENFTIDELLRNDFIIGVTHNERVLEAIELIDAILKNNNFVLEIPNHTVWVDKIENDIVYIAVYYWYRTDEIKAPGGKLKTDLQLNIYATLKQKNFNLPTTTVVVQNL